MSRLAALILLAVTVTHYGVDPMCSMFPALAHAAKGLFYVLHGAEGALLFLVIVYLRPVLWPVCTWGAFEEGESAVCRLASGPLDTAPHAADWSGLCGDVTGVPLYAIGLVVAAVLATWKHGQ